jgi:CheY-like chemotaxis protein
MYHLAILDDSRVSGRFVEKVSRKNGFEVSRFSNPREFLEHYRETRDTEDAPSYRGLVLDLLMPEMDGVEVVRRLAELESELDLILASSVESKILQSTETLAGEQGIQVIDTLRKPIEVDALKDALTRLKDSSPGRELDSEFEITRGDLEKAIEKGEIVAHFQPQNDLNTGELFGVESFARWEHPEQGFISPGVLIALFEEEELMEPMANRIIEESVRQ